MYSLLIIRGYQASTVTAAVVVELPVVIGPPYLSMTIIFIILTRDHCMTYTTFAIYDDYSDTPIPLVCLTRRSELLR